LRNAAAILARPKVPPRRPARAPRYCVVDARGAREPLQSTLRGPRAFATHGTVVASLAYDRLATTGIASAIAVAALRTRNRTMNSPYASSASHGSTSAKLSLAWTNVKGLVQNHALLAVLELQRAGISLVKMVAAGIIISILVVSAWMALVAAAVVWAVGAGANWGIAILIAALVNIGIAVGLAFWAKSQVPDLLFAATLRQLRKDMPKAENEHAPNRSVA
jgi:uncharacterized membrane protein YqjE